MTAQDRQHESTIYDSLPEAPKVYYDANLKDQCVGFNSM